MMHKIKHIVLLGLIGLLVFAPTARALNISRFFTPPSSLIAHWRAEGTAKDERGRNNGTLQGVTFATGRIGRAFSGFGGSAEYITVLDTANSSLDITSAITMSAWVYWSGGKSAGQNSYVVDKQNQYSFLLNSSGQARLMINYPSLDITTTEAIATNEWHYIAATYDRFASGNTANIYIDGVLKKQDNTFNGAINTDNNELRIGCYSNSGGACNAFGANWGWSGRIDEVKLYNRALTAAEVRAEYRATARARAAVQQGLVSHWRAEGNARDSRNANNGTLAGNAAFVAGKLGKTFTFDGSGDYVNIGDPANLDDIFDGPFTISLWLKRAAVGAYQIMFSKQETTGDLKGTVLGTNNVNTDNAYFYLSGSPYLSNTLELKSTNAVFSTANRWYHYVVTSDGSKTVSGTKVYVDGASVAVTSILNNLSGDTSTTADMYIGGRMLGTNSSNGQIDEVKIYNRALSAQEIMSEYRYGAPKIVRISAPPSGAVAHWRAEGNAKDERGRNNGTLQGNVAFTAGKIGRAFSFDGTGDYVLAGTDRLYTENATSFSIAAWVYADSSIFDGTAKVFLDSSTANTNNNGFWFALDDRGVGQATNGFHIRYATATGASRDTAADNIFSATPRWYHVVATYTPSIGKIYVNGADATTSDGVNFTGTGNFVPRNANFSIGAANDGTFATNAKIDEIKLYNRALTAAEVLSEYKAGR